MTAARSSMHKLTAIPNVVSLKLTLNQYTNNNIMQTLREFIWNKYNHGFING